MIFLILLCICFGWLLWKFADRLLFSHLTLCYLLSSQINTIIDMIVVNKHLIEFPIRLFSSFSNISITFDYILFPIFHCFYYQWTYDKKFLVSLVIAILMTGGLTAVEMMIERYTSLITYLQWNNFYTFSSVLIVLILTRFIVRIWFRNEIKMPLQ